MRYGQHPERFFVSLLFALALGILAGLAFLPELQGWPGSLWFMVLLGSLLLTALAVWRQPALAWPCFVLLFFLLGAGRLQQAVSLPADDISRFAGRTVSVAGRLTGEMQAVQDTTGFRVSYPLAVTGVRHGRGKWEQASGGVVLYGHTATREEAEARIGDLVQSAGELRLIHGYQNPGQIDTALLRREEGITANVFAGKNKIVVKAEEAAPLLRLAAGVRQHYREAMQQVMPPQDAAAIFALLFGGYDGLDPELVESFTITGLIHILSVSGSHISLVAAAIAGICLLLRLPMACSAVLVTAAIAFYALLAGFVPPVVRAAVMGGLTFLALALGRERDSRHILLLTGMAMLLYSPLLLFHISFELSFLATAGLLYLAPVFHRWLRARRVPAAISLGLSITLAAQLATLPVLAWYFQRVSIVALLANLVVTPLLDVLILLGLLSGLVALLLPTAGGMLFGGCSLLLGLASEMTRWLAALPFSVAVVPAFPFWAVLLFYLLLFLPALPAEWRGQLAAFLRRESLAAGLFLLGLGTFLAIGHCMASRELTVHFIDAGQGDAALVMTPSGKAVLFDAGGRRTGSFDIGERVTLPYLRHYGVRRLEAVFLTHAHEDHAQGCGAILHALPVGAVYTAGEGRDAYARSMRLGDNDPVLSRLQPVTRGQRFEVDGLTIEVLHAPQAAEEGDKRGNEASNVYRLRYGDASFLITGDLTAEGEAGLLACGADVRATVLKVAHHGSRTSTSEAFLQAAHPAYGVICAGRDNSFGHPHAEVVARLQQHEVKILRTDRDGAVVFATDGRRLRISTYREQSLTARLEQSVLYRQANPVS